MELEINTDIKHELSRIALEANVLSNMASSIASIFPSFLEKLETSFAQAKDIPEVKIEHTEDQKFVVSQFHTKQYLDLAELAVLTPEGFKGKYTDYANVLMAASKSMNTIKDSVLKPYLVYLSQFISNKDSKLSTKDMTNIYDGLAHDREAVIDDMDKFRGGGTNSKAKLGLVINRKADIVDIYTNTFLLTRYLKNVNLKEIQDIVKQCVDLLNEIVREVQNGKIKFVTPEVTKNLAYGATEIAREVEFIAMVHYRALGFTTAVDDMTRVITRYIKGIH